MIRPHKLFGTQVGKMWIPEQLARRRELTWNEKAVWARLARYEGKTGEARPKLETLAAELGISWDTAQRAVLSLEAHGLIRVTRRNHSRRPSLVEFLDHRWLRETPPQDAVTQDAVTPDPTPPQIAVTHTPQIAVTGPPQDAVAAPPQVAVAEGSHVEGSQVEGSQQTTRGRSPQEELWVELEACRIAHCNEAEVEPGESKRRTSKAINAMLLSAVEHLGFADRQTPAGVITRWDQLGDLYEQVYLAGDFGKDGTPPWPIELFCSRGVLDNAKRKADKLPTTEAA